VKSGEKNVQVPISFLRDVQALLQALQGASIPSDVLQLAQAVEEPLRAKLERIERRDVFTAYKTAEVGSDGRETARQNYLDVSGVHRDWRSPKETFN